MTCSDHGNFCLIANHQSSYHCSYLLAFDHDVLKNPETVQKTGKDHLYKSLC